jgi:hypothetical protein
MNRTLVGWIIAVVGVAAIVSISLVNDRWQGAILGLSIMVGLFVGDFLIRGASRLFGWGQSAERTIFVMGNVGWVISIVLLLVLMFPLSEERTLFDPATIAAYTAVFVVVGAAGATLRLSKKLRNEEESRPEEQQ